MAFRKMRRQAQETSAEECCEVLSSGMRGVLALAGDEGWPYCLPVNYFYEPGEKTIYIHCAGEGHKIDAIGASDKACFTVWREDYHDEGDWAWHLTSVIAFGRASMVCERERMLEKITKFAYKYFPTAEEAEEQLKMDHINRFHLIALHIEHMSGKRVYEK